MAVWKSNQPRPQRLVDGIGNDAQETRCKSLRIQTNPSPHPGVVRPRDKLVFSITPQLLRQRFQAQGTGSGARMKEAREPGLLKSERLDKRA